MNFGGRVIRFIPANDGGVSVGGDTVRGTRAASHCHCTPSYYVCRIALRRAWFLVTEPLGGTHQPRWFRLQELASSYRSPDVAFTLNLANSFWEGADLGAVGSKGWHRGPRVPPLDCVHSAKFVGQSDMQSVARLYGEPR